MLSISPRPHVPISSAFSSSPALASPTGLLARTTRSTSVEPPQIPGPAWTVLHTPSDATLSAQGDAELVGRQAAALSSAQVYVSVPRVSALGDVMDMYHQLVDQPQTRQWLASKGLETDSLTLHKDRVEGYVTRDGVRTAVTFSTTDGSGWWEASIKLRAMRNLLDPDDKGLPYPTGGEQRMPLHVVSNAYGLNLPGTTRTAKDGLSAQFVAALGDVKRVVSDLDERAHLATLLEQRVQGLADELPTNWSTQQTRVSQASAQGIGVQASYNVQQLLEHKGLGSPSTIGATRNVIQWLRTSLPPAPASADYSALATTDGVADYRPLASLAGQSPDSLRQDADAHLARLLKGPDAPAFTRLLADIATQPPGTVAGFELYQPAHLGRTLNEVRSDLEQHLRDQKGLDPSVAVLVAHIGLAQVAPEFLVRDIPDIVTMGSPAWVELRLGCAIAEAVGPGTSRAMNEEQLNALTTLAPISVEQSTLLQVRGLRVLLDWGVLNGVVAAKPHGQHTETDAKLASKVFTRQRTMATRAFKTTNTPLPTRRSMAIQELLKVFPQVSANQLEAMKVQLVDADQRRNLVRSEPRIRSLVETYMTGDLVPDKWVLSSELPSRPSGQSSSTPFQFQNTAQVPKETRATLDEKIRRLPALDPLFEKPVSAHHRKLQMAFVTKLKLMFAALPLADRQRIELGAVDLFTLRKKTGKQQVWEKDDDRAAMTGRQGTLMRVLHAQSVTYYEVFTNGKIVKHTDPEVTSALDKVVRDKSYLGQFKLLGEKYIRGGHDVPLDFEAYASGAAPRPGAKSSDVIIDRVGRYLEAGSLPENQTLQTFVPDSYQSDRVEFLACEIAENNFYESLKDMLKRARGQLSIEKSREAEARDMNLLLSLVPFIGAYQDFAQGNIGKGLQSLALDIGGVVVGARVQARSLMRSGKTFALGGVRTALNQMSAKVAPVGARLSLAGPQVRISDAAFDLAKQSAVFFNAVFNPVDGYPRLIGAAARGVGKLPMLLATSNSALGKAMPHLMTAEQKMRGYFLVATGVIDPSTPPEGRPA
ncbi:hypothetical protein [Pseudomonas sp. 18175]|uniref:hypothetical protein n=1 Tax=Pseudomonas sp. 18175 TaxID=3390056 RepID=UPI003D263C59